MLTIHPLPPWAHALCKLTGRLSGQDRQTVMEGVHHGRACARRAGLLESRGFLRGSPALPRWEGRRI